MLTIKQKIKYFEEYLLDNSNWMKEELYLYFFELENGNFKFLEHLNSKTEIENKINFLISKMAMHEHEDSLFNIIESYI